MFVYGTLMRGGANHAVLERLGARFGELYALREAALPALDIFEGSPDLYVRERIALALITEEGFAEAWVYVLAKRVDQE